MTFTLVVPVKGTPGAKSRLGASYELSLSLALDTVEVAQEVSPVIVVTSELASAAFRGLGARVLVDPRGGLNAAIDLGLSSVDGPAGVLLGDLPALTAAELSEALDDAALHELSFVPDVDGVGTTLITAWSAQAHRPAFGGFSRAAHLAAGYIELSVAVDSGLRQDVDTREQLAALTRLGPRTRAALGW